MCVTGFRSVGGSERKKCSCVTLQLKVPLNQVVPDLKSSEQCEELWGAAVEKAG